MFDYQRVYTIYMLAAILLTHVWYISGQILATSHDLTIKGSFLEGNSPYFRKIQVGGILQPCKSKDYFLNGFSVKTIVLVGIYNQQFQGTIILMVFDFQGQYNLPDICFG